jgi:sugar/nucleoside kinase (ribokinase family)
MPTYDASFVGLTILDISGRPIRKIPDGGDVEFIDEIRLNPAGTAAGALMNAAKLGLKCTSVACLGNDEKGEFILDYYKRLGNIDCDLIQKTTEAPTSATILPIRPNGDRPALHQRGASDKLFVAEEDFDRVCDANVLHHGGTGLLKAMDESCQSAKLLAYAKSKGVITTLDLIAPSDETMDLLRQMLPHVDYFMPSMEEALFLSKASTPQEAAQFFMDMGAGACIFKWGDMGSFVKSATPFDQAPSWCPNFLQSNRIPAFQVDVKDTTGCGDAYCGGFVAGLAQNRNVLDACRLGTAASALVATGLGSDAGVVDLPTTLRFMETAEIKVHED